MEDGKPEMNATPLIDVLLVLLVMLIITLPMATHQTTIGFPFAGKSVRPPVEVRLLIDFDDRMFWNGVEIADEAELSGNLRSAARPRVVRAVRNAGVGVELFVADGGDSRARPNVDHR